MLQLLLFGERKAAQLLGVSTKTLRRIVKAGQICLVGVGKAFYEARVKFWSEIKDWKPQ